MPRILLGLGSNIDPETNLRAAAALLREHFGNIRFSSVYRTAPQGYAEQPEFLNAAALLETEASPEEIASSLREIEQALGKSPPFCFGPRTIDLDLLLYEEKILPDLKQWHAALNQKLKTKNYELVVPHPRMHERRFVLEPLCELISREEEHPVLRTTWAEFLVETLGQDCRRTALTL